jgi:hypothetical protein
VRNGYLRENLWKNVYLLEFYNTNTESPSDSFACGVPPESEEFVLSQRKSETKTFGGLVVDDYGCNELKISLSGSTVNNEMRRIYHTNGQQEYMSGEDEIFAFKAMLEKYKRNPNTMGKKILLYDLSKHSQINRRKKTVDSFCWQVFPGELKIKRSKERPIAYSYSIEFTAIAAEKMSSFEPERILGVDFNQAFDKIQAFLDKAETGLAPLKGISEKIRETSRFVDACKDVARLAVGGTLNISNLFIDDVFAIGNTAFELYRQTVGGALPFSMELVDFVSAMTVDLMRHINGLAKDVHSATKKEFYMPVGVFDDWDIAMDEIRALADLNFNDAARTASDITVSAKIERPRTYEIASDSQQRVTAYGTQLAMMTDGMSFEQLAKEQYGDASKAFVIASANGASSIEDMTARNSKYILIPVLEQKEMHYENNIIGMSAQRDSYGKDIALDEYGNLQLDVSGTDFAFKAGKQNLSQSILMRLRENINKRTRLQVYGIRTTLPDSEAAGSAYILSSIIQTLNHEPRIKDLLGVSFHGEGDALKIDIDYRDIGGSRDTINGTV